MSGIQMMVLGGTFGSEVYLAPGGFSINRVSATTGWEVGIQLNADGKVYESDASAGPAWSYTAPGGYFWLNSGTASTYDCYLSWTNTFGTLTGTTATWLNLGTTRSWYYTGPTTGAYKSGSGTLQIATAANHAVILASMSVSLYTEYIY